MTRRSCSPTGRCRRSAAELAGCRRPSGGVRRRGVCRPLPGSATATTSRRNPRTSRKSASCWRWLSQATQVLRRFAVCSFGLFQPRTQTACGAAALRRTDRWAGRSDVTRLHCPAIQPRGQAEDRSRPSPGGDPGWSGPGWSSGRAVIDRRPQKAVHVVRRAHGCPPGGSARRVPQSRRGRDRVHPFPTGVGDDHREVGDQQRGGHEHPAHPALGEDGDGEAHRADAHGDDVAPGTCADVLAQPGLGTADLVDGLAVLGPGPVRSRAHRRAHEHTPGRTRLRRWVTHPP